MTIRKNCLFAVGILVAALTGCAAKSIRNDFSFNSESNEGLVVLSVSHDLSGKRGAKAIFYIDGGLMGGGQALLSLDETVPGISRGSEFMDSYGHVLVLALPPGKHSIDSWQITNGTGLRILPKEKPTPLVFEVRSKEIKYVGNLHGNMQLGKNFFGMTIVENGYPEVRDQRQRDISLFERKYPQFIDKAVIDLLPLGPWVESSETGERVDLAPVSIQK